MHPETLRLSTGAGRAPAPLRAQVMRLLERLLPPGADAEVRRRSIVIVTFTVIVLVAVVACAPFDAAQGNWSAVALAFAGGGVAAAMLPVLRCGHVELTAHVNTGLFVFGLLGIAVDKGGIAAPEMAWLCSAVVFGVLALGSRAGLAWTLIACGGLFAHALAFDPAQVGSATPAFAAPIGFAIDHTVLLLVTWGLAVAFDRARNEYLARLGVQTAEMRRVLEHSRDGLLTIDREGRIAAERSARAEVLLGPIPADASLWDIVARHDARAGGALQVGWEAVLDDFLPREVTIAQLPRRIVAEGRALEVELIVIEEAGTITGALVVLHDITDELSRERAERANRDLLEVFEHARADGTAVAEFVREMDRLAEAIAKGADAATLLRDIHTMKGNAGMFGVRSIADLCHEVEQRAADGDGVPSAEDRKRLWADWAVVSRELRGWTKPDDDRSVDVTPDDVADLQRALDARAPHAELSRIVGCWKLQPISRMLGRLARQAGSLANGLGKPLRIDVEPTNGRADGDRMAPLLSALVHVVRNAIDHGIEPEEERAARGKPPTGTLRLAARFASDMLHLEIADDGRGVDWEAVRRKAAIAGSGASLEALTDILFADGFSTRESVTTISGRGVGLGAVRSVVRGMGGDIALDSRQGHGTTFHVSVPAAYATGHDRTVPTRTLLAS